MSIIDEITKEFTNKKVPSFRGGDTVRVFIKIKEGEKERIQYFEGVVIAIHRNGVSTTFKVRKTSYGVGVERTFPLYSPLIQKIEIKKRGDVRRGKLYYLRDLTGKKARVKEKKTWMIKKKEVLEEEAAGVPPAETPAIMEDEPVEASAGSDTGEVVEDAATVEAEEAAVEETSGGMETGEAAPADDTEASGEESHVDEPSHEGSEDVVEDDSSGPEEEKS